MELRSRFEYQTFLQSYPQYASTSVIDSIRRSEFAHLNEPQAQVSFDYGGAGLFSTRTSNRLVDFELSYTSSGLATHALYEDEKSLEGVIRRRILAYLKLDHREYCIVFAAGALSALRLLAESYELKHLLLGYDFENESLSRIRRISQLNGTKVSQASFSRNFELDEESLRRMLQAGKKKPKKQGFKGVLAYPMISRVTGAEHSVEWIREAHSNGWLVLLDVSGCGACCTDLASLNPDFLVCSFYKVFGMDPAGFGCLVMKKRALSKLTSREGALGMVKLASPKNSFTSPPESDVLKPSFLQNLLSMVSPRSQQDHSRFSGLDYAEKLRIYIMLRQEALLSWLRSSLGKLRHQSNSGEYELVQIHSPPNSTPTLAFSLVDYYGEVVEPKLVQRLANRSNISLGTGVIRVPRTVESFSCQLQSRQSGCLGKKLEATTHEKFEEISVVCVTIGFLTSFWDAFKLVEFVEQFLDSDFCSRELLKYQGINQSTIL